MRTTLRHYSRRLAPLALALACGCALRSKERDFKPVQETVAERTGARVEWITNSAEDEEVARAVKELLKEDLTAAGAMQVALLNNRKLQATFEDLGIAQADLVQAGMLKNPHVGFAFSYLKTTGGYTAQGLEYEFVADFLDLLLIPLKKRGAKAELERAKMEVAHEALDLASDTQQAFYTLQARMQLAETVRMAADADEAAADLARRQLDAGNINELEYSNHFSTYLESKADAARLDIEIRADRERLNRLMGVWGEDAAWRIAPRMPEMPAEEGSVEDVEARAIERRLDLEVARKQVDRMRYALKLTKWERIPPFSFVMHYERGNIRNPSHRDTFVPPHHQNQLPSGHHNQPPFGHHNSKTDTGGPGGGGTGGTGGTGSGKIPGSDYGYDELIPKLEFELPIFDQGQAKVARALAEFRQAEKRLLALATDIRSEAREARDRMTAARKMAEFYRDVLLPERQKALVLAQVAYNGMHLGVYDLLTAKQMELKTHREYIEAMREYWIARAELNEAVGGGLGIEKPAEAPAPQEEGKP